MSRASRLPTIETELKSFAVRDYVVEFDERSDLVAVRHRSSPGWPYLTELRVRELDVDGRSTPWRIGAAVVDSDEVELTALADGLASVVLRHTFGAAWRTRLALRNISTRTWTGRLALRLTPGSQCRVWSLTAGRDSTYALLPPALEAPILVAHCTSGSAATVTERGFELGPISLDPGLSIVAAWDWRTAASPRLLADRLPGTLPWDLTARLGEEIWLPADPDTAVLMPDDVQVIVDQDHRAAVATRPGRHRVELRSARGSTTLDLSWVPAVSDFLTAVAEHLLGGARGPNGVVRIADISTALVLQWAAREAGFVGAAEAGDALDLFTARLDHSALGAGPRVGASSALEIIYLAGEYDRQADPDLLEACGRRLAGMTGPAAGLGLAVMRTGLASVLAGRRPPRPPTGRSVGPEGLDPDSSFSAAAAALEYALATETPERITGDETLARVYRVGIELRAGLPGRVPATLPADQLSHCLAVLRLVPDTVNPYWMDKFGRSISTVTDARALELVDRLSGAPVTTAHAWLALSS